MINLVKVFLSRSYLDTDGNGSSEGARVNLLPFVVMILTTQLESEVIPSPKESEANYIFLSFASTYKSHKKLVISGKH